MLLTVFTTTLLGGETHVIDDVWFDLADCYQGEAIFNHATAGNPIDWKRVEFFLAEDLLSMKSFRFESNGAETLFDERFGNLEASTLIYHDASSAMISARFRDSLTDAAEDHISPISIMRLINLRRNDIGLHIVNRKDDGTVTIGFSLTTFGNTEEHEFDVLDRRITEYRSVKRNGQFITTIQYKDWQLIDNNQPIPTRIMSTIDTGTDQFVEHIRIESAHAAAAGDAPKKPTIPGSYSIDVTALKASNASSPYAPTRTPPRAITPILLAIVALLVVVPVILILYRSRRAS